MEYSVQNALICSDPLQPSECTGIDGEITNFTLY